MDDHNSKLDLLAVKVETILTFSAQGVIGCGYGT